MREILPQTSRPPLFITPTVDVLGLVGVTLDQGDIWGGLLFILSFTILSRMWKPALADFWRFDDFYPSRITHWSVVWGLVAIIPFLVLSGLFTILLFYGAYLTLWWGVLGLGPLLIVWILFENGTNPFHIGYATGATILAVVSLGLGAFGVSAEQFLKSSGGHLVTVACLIPAFVMWGLAATNPTGNILNRTPQTSTTQRVTANRTKPGNQGNNTATDSAPDNQKQPEQTNSKSLARRTGDISREDLTFNWEIPPDVGFDDIGGYDDVKSELKEDVIAPLETDHPGYERFDVDADRGILFYGPPGTGKTLFAKALASSLNRPFVELNQADLTSKFINESPGLISTLFDEAQQLEGVIFIDEAETLFGGRGSSLSSHQEDQKVTTTFLSELSRDERTFVLILATNRREDIDDAVVRPGRIDKQVELALPEATARYEILRTELRDVPHEINETMLKLYAVELEGRSGAEIEQVVDDARRNAAERNAEQLEFRDFDDAVAARVRKQFAEDRADAIERADNLLE